MNQEIRCNLCGLCQTANWVRVDSRGAEAPDFFFIGEAPGPEEDRQGQPFIGPAGNKLMELIQRSGIDLNQCRFGNIVRCIPRDEPYGPFRQPKPSEVTACSSHLFTDILQHKPKIIIPVGKPAFKALTGNGMAITKARGSLFRNAGLFSNDWFGYDFDLWRYQYCTKVPVDPNDSVDPVFQPTFPQFSEEWHAQRVLAEDFGYSKPDYTMLPIVHPSYILRGAMEYEAITVQDLGLAQRVASGESWFTDKDYQIINTEAELRAYVEEILQAFRSGECDRISVDLETTHSPDKDTIHLIPYYSWSRILAVAISHKPNHGRVILAQHKDSVFNNPVGLKVLIGEMTRLLSEIPVVNHNIAFDANVLLARWGVKIEHVYGDTMLMHHLCFPKLYSHGLDFIGAQYLGTGGHKADMDAALEALPEEHRSMENVGLETLGSYAAGDADITRQLSYVLEEEMVRVGVSQAYEDIYRKNGAWELVREMMYQGFQIDLEKLAVMQEEWPKRIEAVFDALHEHSPYIQKFYDFRAWEKHNQPRADVWIKATYAMDDTALFHYKAQSSENYYTLVQQAMEAEPDKYITGEQWRDSTQKKEGKNLLRAWQQLQDLWFKVMNVPWDHLEKKHKKGGRGLPKTGTDVRKALIARCKREGMEHEAWVIEQIGNWKKLDKLNGSFIQPLANFVPLKVGEEIDPLIQDVHKIPPPNRTHASYLLHGTNTGRLACSGVNQQQFPEGDIRTCFISRWRGQGGIIISADYSQIEVRIMAIEANDEGLINALNDGRDVHTYTASLINGIPEAQITKELRTPAKSVTFGIIYGQGEPALAAILGVTVGEAEALKAKFLQVLPGLNSFIHQQHARLREDGFVTTRLGRRRVIPEINSKNSHLVAHAERCSVNMPIQSLASDLMLMAMGRINRRSQAEGTYLVPVNIIHDAGMFDCPPGRLLSGMRLIRHEMVVRPQELHNWLIVTPAADFEIGVTWGNMMEANMLEDVVGGSDDPHNLRPARIELLGYPQDYPLLVEELRRGDYQVEELEYTLHPSEEEQKLGKYRWVIGVGDEIPF